MNEQELEIFRLKMRLEVHLSLLRGIYSVLANSSPSAAQALREKFQTFRQIGSTLAVPGLKDGYSDLAAGEYQEALNEALSFIEESFRL